MRPWYGGRLRWKTSAAVRSLDPAAVALDLQEDVLQDKITRLLFEPLVKWDEKGQLQPGLATSWKSDPAQKQWDFQFRPQVRLHDGSLLTPGMVAASLGRSFPQLSISIHGASLHLETLQPSPGMLSELAEPRHSITVQAPDGKWLGTGPFQLEGPESSRPLVFKAFDLYWGGRPFLDFIELETGLAPRDQWMEFELGQADLIEIGPDQFRLASQKQARIWNPSPDQLLALAFGRNCPAVSDLRLREALALSIDRAAIHRVLLQKQGEATAALLPQWLSGYAFLFPAERNLERARLLVSSLPPSQRQLSLVYPAGDSIARLMADRISLNARESGISIRTAAYAFSSSALGPFPCDVAIFCRRIRSFAPGRFLEEMKLLRSAGSAAGVSMPASPLEWHAEEKESLLRLEVIPLFHLAISYGLSRRIHGWPSREEFQPDLWRLENIWVNPGSGTVEKP